MSDYIKKLTINTLQADITELKNGGFNVNAFTSQVGSPTINDDINDGYFNGFYWLNTTDKTMFVCVDNTVGAAIWKIMTIASENGTVTLPSALIFANSVTYNISTSQNNVSITGLETTILLRLNVTANINMTGLVNPVYPSSIMLAIFNVGTNNVIFKNNDAGSSAENRFCFGADVTIQSQEGLTIIYDDVSLCWRSPGKNI